MYLVVFEKRPLMHMSHLMLICGERQLLIRHLLVVPIITTIFGIPLLFKKIKMQYIGNAIKVVVSSPTPNYSKSAEVGGFRNSVISCKNPSFKIGLQVIGGTHWGSSSIPCSDSVMACHSHVLFTVDFGNFVSLFYLSVCSMSSIYPKE